MFDRNNDFKPFEKKVWLAFPTMHGVLKESLLVRV